MTTNCSIRIQSSVYPYVRMTRRGMYVNPRAMAYRAWQEGFRIALRMAYHDEMFPAQTPLSVSIKIGEPILHTHDIDNSVKAVLDACNGIVCPDDRWIDRLETERVQCDVPYVMIDVEVMG